MHDDARLPSMRAADSDREVALETLRQSHAEGRLTTPEFYERLDAVYQARTYAELDATTVDLPALGVRPPERAPLASPKADVSLVPAGGARGLPAPLIVGWLAWATAVSINVLIWLILTITHVFGPGDAWVYPWPIWVAGPWGVVLTGLTAAWWFTRGGGTDEPPALPPGHR